MHVGCGVLQHQRAHLDVVERQRLEDVLRPPLLRQHALQVLARHPRRRLQLALVAPP